MNIIIKRTTIRTIETSNPEVVYELREWDGLIIVESVSYKDGKIARIAEIGRFESEADAVLAACKNCQRRGLSLV